MLDCVGGFKTREYKMDKLFIEIAYLTMCGRKNEARFKAMSIQDQIMREHALSIVAGNTSN